MERALVGTVLVAIDADRITDFRLSLVNHRSVEEFFLHQLVHRISGGGMLRIVLLETFQSDRHDDLFALVGAFVALGLEILVRIRGVVDVVVVVPVVVGEDEQVLCADFSGIYGNGHASVAGILRIGDPGADVGRSPGPLTGDQVHRRLLGDILQADFCDFDIHQLLLVVFVLAFVLLGNQEIDGGEGVFERQVDNTAGGGEILGLVAVLQVGQAILGAFTDRDGRSHTIGGRSIQRWRGCYGLSVSQRVEIQMGVPREKGGRLIGNGVPIRLLPDLRAVLFAETPVAVPGVVRLGILMLDGENRVFGPRFVVDHVYVRPGENLTAERRETDGVAVGRTVEITLFFAGNRAHDRHGGEGNVQNRSFHHFRFMLKE